jgi:hypothetical protein
MSDFEWINGAKMASWWLVFEDLGWPDSAVEDKWRKRAERFSRQGVNTVVFFGFHLRWDYIYLMERVLEIQARIADICHEHGLRVVEHHSAMLVHRVRNVDDRWEIYNRNRHHVPFYPDSWDNMVYNGSEMSSWRQINGQSNQPVFFERYTCECFCPNNPDYQQGYLDLAGRIVRHVRLDGFMSDDLHYLPNSFSCVCEHCKKRFYQEAGVELAGVDDSSFWGNRDNKDFLEWIRLRYQWNADHYKRLRNFLPKNIALWGCASDALIYQLNEIGFDPFSYAEHWDAVFHEIISSFNIGADNNRIVPGLASFAGIAEQFEKPLVAIFYADKPENVGGWLEMLSLWGCRPWLSKKARDYQAACEEELLANGFDYPEASADNIEAEKINFSRDYRDSLNAEKGNEYVSQVCSLINNAYQNGKRPLVVFE